ncbi:hypothetical protein ASD00_17155 [Ensifer sp. Root31]|nr:hypothetical protein ASD00_17155 [Ensifer sp. Root31]
MKWPLQKPPISHSIVVKTKAENASSSGQIGLLLKDILAAKIVKAKRPRETRLEMPLEQRLSFHHTPPFAKTLSPINIVDGIRIKLRQVKCDWLNIYHIGNLYIEV